MNDSLPNLPSVGTGKTFGVVTGSLNGPAIQDADGRIIIGAGVAEQIARAQAPGHDPTCVLCETGEEPGHEH